MYQKFFRTISDLKSDLILAALEEVREGPITKGDFGKIQGFADQVIAEIRSDDGTQRTNGVKVAQAWELRGNFLGDVEETDKAKNDYFEALGLLISTPGCKEDVGRFRESRGLPNGRRKFPKRCGLFGIEWKACGVFR